jgi:hypothetical protein
VIVVVSFSFTSLSLEILEMVGLSTNNDKFSERNYRSPTRQKREENKFGEYTCVRTRQSVDPLFLSSSGIHQNIIY